MRSVENTRPRPGLSVPVITALGARGELREDDQRAAGRHVIQSGWGADIVFAAGTTGEWDRAPAELTQRVVAVCVEEVKKANARAAIAAGADALVLAPLAVRDAPDAVRFVARDVADLLDASVRRVPVYLYDNAAIATDPDREHLRTKQVKALSRLDFVRGIKVSAPKRVLGNYTRAARSASTSATRC